MRVCTYFTFSQKLREKTISITIELYTNSVRLIASIHITMAGMYSLWRTQYVVNYTVTESNVLLQIRRQAIGIQRTSTGTIEPHSNLPRYFLRHRSGNMANAWYFAGLVVESQGRNST